MLTYSLGARSSTKQFICEDPRQDTAEDGVSSTAIAAVLVMPVEAVFIAAAEPLAEVVAVVVLGHVITVVAVVRVLVGNRSPVIGTPAILAVSHSGPKTFRITVLYGLLKLPIAVAIRLVVDAATIVTTVIRRPEVGVILVVEATRIPVTSLLLKHLR